MFWSCWVCPEISKGYRHSSLANRIRSDWAKLLARQGLDVLLQANCVTHVQLQCNAGFACFVQFTGTADRLKHLRRAGFIHQNEYNTTCPHVFKTEKGQVLLQPLTLCVVNNGGTGGTGGTGSAGGIENIVSPFLIHKHHNQLEFHCKHSLCTFYVRLSH